MLISRALPPGAVGEDALGEPASGAYAALFPAEAREVERAGEKRRREFAAARRCAHRALAALGLPAAPLLPGPDGAPVWPPGVTGSITHCDGYRAAAVARTDAVARLGIDAEPNAPLPRSVRHGITSPTERAHLRRLDAVRPDVHWDRLLFSAKEAFYKASAAAAHRPLRFDDAEVTFREEAGAFGTAGAVGTFTVRRGSSGAADGDGPHPTGNWHAAHGFLVTAVAVPARA
ncbi:4'-phosphopantetheinyl transferase [Streptomyces sp. Da 82-17]|uniref:4'-phosphopantetheinyl transferase family protein n=1 Tax=Streptomyces sp. Da 82-17 TaxID=3377116 RepID=UPI0038D4F616